MLIRSQDRKTIVNMENIDTICVVRDEYDSKEIKEHYRSVIRYFNGGEETMGTLASYSAEEKAIKVLDMMQKQYSHCVAGNIFMNGRIDRVNEMASEVAECCVREHIDMQVFQMPQDSEV